MRHVGIVFIALFLAVGVLPSCRVGGLPDKRKNDGSPKLDGSADRPGVGVIYFDSAMPVGDTPHGPPDIFPTFPDAGIPDSYRLADEPVTEPWQADGCVPEPPRADALTSHADAAMGQPDMATQVDATIEAATVACTNDLDCSSTSPICDLHTGRCRMKFLHIVTGLQVSCGLRVDGIITCWGGGWNSKVSPPQGSFLDVSNRCGYVCARRVDHTVACWDLTGGNPTTPPTETFMQVSAGYGYACGLKTSGALACWGWSFGSGGEAPPPDAYAQAFVSVSASIGMSYNQTCALTAEGTAYCWKRSDTPSVVVPGPFVQISVSGQFVLGRSADGSVTCWGECSGLTPPTGAFTLISAGLDFACGIRTDGTVGCWGNNKYEKTSPPAGSFVDVSAGFSHVCAVRSDGTAVCWGSNDYGESTPP
jgi:hypothetical protein